jgi:hypothetical protein
MSGKVQIVHAIDTEGPLYESLTATFERLHEIFGISHILPTMVNLQKLQKGQFDLGENTTLIQDALSSHRVSTLGTWDQVDNMLSEVTDESFRRRLPDSNGNGWVFNWFCLDHVGFDTNPRKRDIGYHNIHDRYVELLEAQPFSRDSIEWHFHPMSTYREAHRCATHYFRSDEIFQILCRRIIDRNFFPSCFRAGFQAERPDSHWFLEQFIPFDISNMATADTTDIDNSIDFKNGRSGNWRKAPDDWSVYHPSHDDYQLEGSCRRLIGRSLNLRNRIGNLTQAEMDNAFAQAAIGKTVLVGLCSHDWRDLKSELDMVQETIVESTKKYPDVPFEYCQADEAFQEHVDSENAELPPLELSLTMIPGEEGGDVPYIMIEVVQGKVFGPQPFLAIKTRSNRYLHDNLDFANEDGRWYYAFHADTLPLDDVECIGVAANDFMGRTVVKILRPKNYK